MAESR